MDRARQVDTCDPFWLSPQAAAAPAARWVRYAEPTDLKSHIKN
jgi:hypothetical protein